MKLLNKSILPLLLIVIVILILWRMENYSTIKFPKTDTIEYVFKLAGDDSTELKKVLQHFRNDSMKLNAARFLIKYMADNREVKWQCYRNGKTDTTFDIKKFKNRFFARKFMDSLNIKYKPVAAIPDYTVISSEYLIKHIKRAFRSWHKPENKHLSFRLFKETLLPYRTATEKLEDSYSYTITKYDSLFNAVSSKSTLQKVIAINNVLKKEITWNSRMLLYPGSLTCIEMDKIKTGHCEHLVNYGLKVFRAAGIAIGTDFVPAWGDSNAGHAWNVLYLPHKKIPFAACGDNPGEFPFFWRAPKVFRRTYQAQTIKLLKFKSKEQDVPYELTDNHRIDVTDNYYETVNISVPLNQRPPKNNNCAFLCVYNNYGWRAVDWGKIDRKSNKAVFNNINDSLLYCVMYYNHQKLKPATYPFLVFSSDSLRFLKPVSKTVTLTKIYDYDYYRWNITKPDKEYELLIWDNEWKPAGKAYAYPCYKKNNEWTRIEDADTIPKNKIKYFIDFNNIPANGLYRLTSDSDKRPFWMENEKMTRRFPCKAYYIKQLLK